MENIRYILAGLLAAGLLAFTYAVFVLVSPIINKRYWVTKATKGLDGNPNDVMRSIDELVALNIPRDHMTEEEEKAWVNYWFNTYEAAGFVDKFHTPYDQYKDRVGSRFVVIGRCTEKDCDLECLPMWKIRFEDGLEINAFEIEICKLEIDGGTQK